MDSQRYHILINSSSGTARKMGLEQIQNALAEHRLNIDSFDFLEPQDFDGRMAELMTSSHPILIGGGDGTIAKAAALHLEKDKAFGILPFGTMNLLAKDLNIPVEWPDTLKAHARTRTISIDVGLVNDVPFLCCAALGTMPEAAILREEMRAWPEILMLPRLTGYIFEQMDMSQKRKIYMTIGGKTRKLKTSMIVVSNNRFDSEEPEQPFKKETLQDAVLGVYTVTPRNLIDKMRLLFRMQKSGWSKDSTIDEYKARELIITTNKAEELISVDGEPMTMQMPLRFKILKRALKVIVPANNA